MYNKSIYEQADMEINRRRLNAKSILQERQQDVYSKIPEIKEIENQLSQTNVELVKLVIGKKGDFKNNFNRIKEQNLSAQDMLSDMLSKNGYPADYLLTPYSCSKCHDSGVFEGDRCSCYQDILNKIAVTTLNKSANLPVCDFEHFSLDYYKSSQPDCYETMKRIYEGSKNYADTFSTSSQSLLFYGNTGLGKTHLSLAIAKAVTEKGYNVAYGSLLNFLSAIEKEHFGKTDTDNDTMNVLINADLLIIDDLGSEFHTPFYETATYNIINSRINLSLPTIISTNLPINSMQDRYNDRIISRIFGAFTTFCFVGQDIRQQKRLRGI